MGWRDSLLTSELDPLSIEICRRVRLVSENGRIAARAGGSKVPRIVPIPGGAPGDPWAPTITDKDGIKILTVDAGGFHYRRMVRLLFGRDGHELPVLAETLPTDAEEGLVILARALTRGQGKTEGLHERRIPITRTVYRAMRARATDAIGLAATERVTLAGEIQNRVLKPALLALFQNGPETVDYQDKGANARARDLLAGSTARSTPRSSRIYGPRSSRRRIPTPSARPGCGASCAWSLGASSSRPMPACRRRWGGAGAR